MERNVTVSLWTSHTPGTGWWWYVSRVHVVRTRGRTRRGWTYPAEWMRRHKAAFAYPQA